MPVREEPAGLATQHRNQTRVYRHDPVLPPLPLAHDEHGWFGIEVDVVRVEARYFADP